MATEVSSYTRDTQPYSCIGLISVTFPDGTSSRGTCTLVGRNDILTATHVVYSPDNGGWAVDYEFYFGADYNDITGHFEDYGYSYSPTGWDVSAWPDQAFADYSNETMLQSEAQYDIAIIGVNTPIGDTLGWLGLDSSYNGIYSAKSVGYPAGATGMMQETVTAQWDSYYEVYKSNYDVMGPGSSGGPLLIGNYVIGVKSTTQWWADVGTVYSYLTNDMDSNDSLLAPMADITAPFVSAYSPVDETTGVSVSSNIILTFSEAIQRGAGSIALKNAAGTVVEIYSAATSSNLSISGNTLTINPTADLAYSTGYKVEFANGSIKDIAGNSYAGTTGYNFTTVAHPGSNQTGTSGNDFFTSTNGNDTFDGGIGIDAAVFGSNLSAYTLTRIGSTYTVHDKSGTDGIDILTNIERLQFTDKQVALDLAPTGNAGQAVLFIGVLAPDLVASPGIVGLILDFVDDGMSMQQLNQLAVDIGLVHDLAGGSSNADVAGMAFENVVGVQATPDMIDMLVGFMDGRSANFTQSEFLTAVANLEVNQVNVDLVGLAQTGIEFAFG